MNTTHTAVLLLSLLSLLTTVLGVALALALRENVRAIAAGIGFSTGLMILIAAVDLVPQSVATVGAGASLVTAAIGAAFVGTAHLAIPHVHLFEEPGAAKTPLARSASLVVLGLVLHDLPEGFGMASAYVASPSLGILVAVAIALHNLPEEFAMALPGVTLSSRRFLFGAAALSAPGANTGERSAASSSLIRVNSATPARHTMRELPLR